MSLHLKREIDTLKKKILSLSALVEESVQQAVASVKKKDEALATKVIDADIEIDQMEVSVEEDCLKILALYQPVATDLRFVVAVLKINDDLERIGDYAVNIAERSLYLATKDTSTILFDFSLMAQKTQLMLKESLDSLVNSDLTLAKHVCASDDEVDALNRETYDHVKAGICKHPEMVGCFLHQLSISRHLERIADLATNIAEDVIYMVEGEIVRHRTEDYDS
jgi:phosphate transport system protein